MKNQPVSLSCAILLSISWLTSSGAQEIKSAKVAKPVVHYFDVAPAGILANQVTILTMNVTGATTVMVTASPCTPPDCTVNYGYPSGTFLLNPSVTTTYTLKATNSGGTVWAMQKVVVGKYINKPPPIPPGLHVTWGGACWYEWKGQEYQAMPFDSQIPTPPGGLPIEGTLYWGSTDCNGLTGTDNLNDFQTLVGSGGLTVFFTNFPNTTGSSAIWTLGNQSSGCVNYELAPKCE